MGWEERSGGRQRLREALAPPLPCLQPAPGPAERSLHLPPPPPPPSPGSTEELGTGKQTLWWLQAPASDTENAEHTWPGGQPSGEPGSRAGSLRVSLGPVKLFVLIKVEGWGPWTVQVGRLLV
ncbi:unnamed protein product [Rangifer tarandus platyrhynchus]|uniref:Uncharacterized protein n=1 Tax=Rangifer tarandus platyrhynchus TaxID=3082113 RepID=A0ABN8Y917_RANTA|nr:unnamed protein product [Rangifer tarandus platyrhynchus]